MILDFFRSYVTNGLHTVPKMDLKLLKGVVASIKRFCVSASLYFGLSSYLRDRTLQVRLGVTFQGSHLDPRLFLIMVNDIGYNFNSECLLLADDLKNFKCIKLSENGMLLQADLNILN